MDWHVIGRGARRGILFATARDYRYFVDLLEEATGAFDLKLKAYCAMPTHYHLLASAEPEDLAKGMQWINYRYTRSYNNRYDGSGHVLEDRYKRYSKAGKIPLLSTSRYIGLNPLDTLPRDAPLSSYPWSSYPAYLGIRTAGFLDLSILDEFASPAAYEAYVKAGIPDFHRARRRKYSTRKHDAWTRERMRELSFTYHSLLKTFKGVRQQFPGLWNPRSNPENLAMAALHGKGLGTIRQIAEIRRCSSTITYKVIRRETARSARAREALDCWFEAAVGPSRVHKRGGLAC